MNSVCIVSVCILLYLSELSQTSESARIIAHPRSVNVLINSTATFQCTTDGGPLYWIIDGSDNPTEWGDGIEYDTRQSSTQQTSTLTVIGRPSRNNTQIICAVYDIESNTAELLIQGLLGAPSSVSVASNGTVLTLIWQEPYTLDITDVEPDILHYLVTVENTFNGDTAHFSVNTSVTRFMYSKQRSVDACTVFSFGVAAVNPVGVGERSVMVNGSFNTYPLLQSASYDAHLRFTCNVSCLANGILWNINASLLDDLSAVHRTFINHNKSSQCHGGQFYIEALHIHEAFRDPTTLSCAAIYACSRRELNQGCVPSICYTEGQVEIAALLNDTSPRSVATETFAPNDFDESVENTTGLGETTSETAEPINQTNYVIIGLGITVAVLTIITLLLMITMSVVVFNRRKVKELNPSKDQEVIYDEPRPTPPQLSMVEYMQQCPAYHVTGHCTFRGL